METGSKPELKHDGFKSRKFLVTALGTLVIEIVASSALFWGLMDATQWVDFNQWLWPLCLGIFCGTNVFEKVLERKK